MPIDPDEMILEKYKIAVDMHVAHDNILWQQSSIFLLAEITILGFGLSLPYDHEIVVWMLKQGIFAVAGLMVASVWLYVNVRRQRFLETLERIKRQAANRLRLINAQFEDVDGAVHDERIRPGMRMLVVRYMPYTFLVVFGVYAATVYILLVVRLTFRML
jgi:hypothetical protein